MKFIINREKDFINVKQITIEINDTRYRIEENREGGLCINKFDFEDSSIQITPRVTNEIYIK